MPCAAQIEFKDVKMRYRPGLPLVLKGLNVCIEAGTTCGVVGRTGKSAYHFCLSSLGFCPLSVAMQHGKTSDVFFCVARMDCQVAFTYHLCLLECELSSLNMPIALGCPTARRFATSQLEPPCNWLVRC